MIRLFQDTMIEVSTILKSPGQRCFLGLVLSLLVASCGSPSDGPDTRKSAENKAEASEEKRGVSSDSALSDTLKKRLQPTEFSDDFFVLKVGAEMFGSLPPDQKASLYKSFRSRAVHRNCSPPKRQYCQVRHILEQILLHPSGVSVSIREKIRRYLKYLWLFGGNQHPVTAKPLRPTFIPGELGAATLIALKNGAAIDLSAVANAPLEANNIEQLEALLDEIRPYIFGSELPEEDSSALLSNDLLPVYFEDANFATILSRLHALADYCDQKVREVGGAKSTAARRPEIPFVAGHILDLPDGQSPLLATSSDVLAMGVVTDGAVGEAHTPVRILWLNVNEAFETRLGERIAKAFSPTRSVYKKRIERRQLVSVAYHGLRNLVGYGADGTENKAADWLSNRLGQNHLLLEELRADLAALYLAYDEEVQKTGLIPDMKTRDALLEEYLFSVVEQIGAGGDPATDRSLKARLIVLNFLIGAGVAKAKAARPGYYALSVSDPAALRTPLIQLLGKVRNIRFFGDPVKAAELVNEFGRIPPGWRQGMMAHFASLDVPPEIVLLLPVVQKLPASGRSKSPTVSVLTPDRFYDRNIQVAAFAAP